MTESNGAAESGQAYAGLDTLGRLSVKINDTLARDDQGELGVNWSAMPESPAPQSSVPAGTIAFYAKSTPPEGWLVCNGAALGKTAYADLYDAIDTQFGGNTTQFNLPDMRGYFPRGWDQGAGVDSGRTFGSQQSDAIRNIAGWLTNVYASWPTANGCFYLNTGWGSYYYAATQGSPNTGNYNFDASRTVPTAAENRPKNIALLPIIKY